MTEPSADSPDSSPSEHDAQTIEVWREALTMALYISLSQLAVMAALPLQSTDAGRELALTVALTSVGLVLAHQVAFRMSSRLFARGSTLDSQARRLLRAQLLGGLIVTAIAALPILIFGAGAYLISMALLLLFVMIIGYLVARSTPVSRPRALIYVALVAVAAVAIFAFKAAVNH